MAVPLVIDGYNLLYALGEGPGQEARERLTRDLVRYARHRGRQVVLVFDAWAQGGQAEQEASHGPVTVLYTRRGERADERIRRWVATRREAVVVTSDREVVRAVERLGAATLAAGAFAERLAAALAPTGEDGDEPSEPARPHGRGSRQAWLRGL